MMDFASFGSVLHTSCLRSGELVDEGSKFVNSVPALSILKSDPSLTVS